jgi:hypothetical protein
VGQYTEVFVGTDVAKARNAIAVADGDRVGRGRGGRASRDLPIERAAALESRATLGKPSPHFSLNKVHRGSESGKSCFVTTA